jgi:1,4-dihydroxy-6-naphthoate synthase
VWWQAQHELPLPLGVVAIRKDVERAADVSAVLREAIDAGLANRDAAMEYAIGFGRGIDAGTADEFVAMYVNDLTLDMGERGRRAIEVLLGREAEFV